MKGLVYRSMIGMQDEKIKVNSTEGKHDYRMKNERPSLPKQDMSAGCKMKYQVYPTKSSMENAK